MYVEGFTAIVPYLMGLWEERMHGYMHSPVCALLVGKVPIEHQVECLMCIFLSQSRYWMQQYNHWYYQYSSKTVCLSTVWHLTQLQENKNLKRQDTQRSKKGLWILTCQTGWISNGWWLSCMQVLENVTLYFHSPLTCRSGLWRRWQGRAFSEKAHVFSSHFASFSSRSQTK